MGFSYMDINSANFFDVKEYEHCFKTEPNEAYFWHGQTSAVHIGLYDSEFSTYAIGGQENAAMIASENGGKTLEMCMREHRDELEAAGVRFNDETGEIRYGDNDIENNAFWQGCSSSFAEQASGDIHVIEGADSRLAYHDNNLVTATPEEDYKKSIWNEIEHPKLEENTKVNSITHINAMTGEETGNVENFDRNNENVNKQSDVAETKGHESTHNVSEGKNSISDDKIGQKEQPKEETGKDVDMKQSEVMETKGHEPTHEIDNDYYNGMGW